MLPFCFALGYSRGDLKADKTKTLEIFKVTACTIREKGLQSPSIFNEVQERTKQYQGKSTLGILR